MLKDLKKIEIITDYVFINKFTGKLDEIGVKGYSIFKDVSGKGSSGNKDGHGLMAGSKNCFILIICESDDLGNIISSLKELTKKFSGIILVSEVNKIV